METYLPIIKAILSDWYLLTIANPLYAAALATLVWLLTAIIYSIRVASLKKKNIAGEKARTEIQNNFNTAQQKLQQMQEELIACTGQMETAKQSAEKEAERAARIEELLSQRNHQAAGIIQSLHTSFDLGERPVPVMGDIKAEGLWQQHDRVITLLTTRLRSEQQAKTELQQSCQAETLKRAEIEALLETLQTTLTAQTSQVAQLEQALAEQKSLLQQHQDKAQQILSQTLEKHLTELARLTELEQQALDLVNTGQQLTQLEEKPNTKDPLIAQPEKHNPVDQVKAQPQAALLKQEEAEIQPVPAAVEQPPESHLKDRYGRAKHYFGGIKQESENIKKDEAETQPAPVEVEQPPVSAAKNQLGKLRNLFGSKQQAEVTRLEEAQPAPSEEQQTKNTIKIPIGKFKNLFGSKQQPEETQQEEAQPAPHEVEQTPVSPVKGQLGKLKNLFGKKK